MPYLPSTSSSTEPCGFAYSNAFTVSCQRERILLIVSVQPWWAASER